MKKSFPPRYLNHELASPAHGEIDRRQFIRHGIAVGIASWAGIGSGCAARGARASSAFAPLQEGPEVEHYKRAQQVVLEKYGVAAESRFVRLHQPTLRLHVLVAGKGDPIILIHGGHAMAVQFAPLIAGLQGQFQCFAPDRPGYGLSDKVDYNRLSIPFRQHAVEVVKSALDRLGLPRAVIAGNSIGGYWAMVFALAAPDRVSKLVLLGGVAGSPKPPLPRRPPDVGTPSLEATRAAYNQFLMADGSRVSREMLEADVAAQSVPGAATAWNSMVERTAQEGGLTKGLAYALRPELGGLKPPTLFLWGDKDLEGPPTLAQEMAALAPRAKCVAVPDSGHLIWLDQPDRCTQLMREFLQTA